MPLQTCDVDHFPHRTKESRGKDDKGKEKDRGKSSDKSEKEKPSEKTPTKSATLSSSVSSAPLGAVSTASTSMAVKRKVETSGVAGKRARKDAHTSCKLMLWKVNNKVTVIIIHSTKLL